MNKKQSGRKRWEGSEVEIKINAVKKEEYDLILDELASIIYSELVKKKSSPNAESSSRNEGGIDAA